VFFRASGKGDALAEHRLVPAASSSEPPTSVGLACCLVGACRRHLVKQGHSRPLRYEYHLTAAGRDLVPVMLGLSVLSHNCGHPFDTRCDCPSCGRPVTPESLTLRIATQ
jgi:hypothetical protein